MKRHINIILLILAISLGLVSCSKEYKAKKLALKELKNTMNDWKSYESVSWGRLDTLYNLPDLDNKVCRSYIISSLGLAMDSIHFVDSLKNIPITDKRYAIVKDSINTIHTKRFKVEKRYDNYLYKYFFIGYKIKHTFRGNNGYGGKVIGTMEFFFNKDLTKVDSTRTIN